MAGHNVGSGLEATTSKYSPVKDGSGGVRLYTTSLYIGKVNRLTHEGTWKCVAENSLGSESLMLRLVVTG